MWSDSSTYIHGDISFYIYEFKNQGVELRMSALPV